MFAARIAQVIGAAGRRGGELNVDFAIEQAQWIAFEPRVAVFAKLIEMRTAPFEQGLAKRGAAGRVAERIDLELDLKAEFAAKLIDHDHQIGVAGGVGASENLDPELVELAKAALLRTLAPEHRAVVVEELLGVAAIEPGFDISAHDARRAFGAQGERGLRIVAIGEGVHLLFDDIGSFAAGALIEFETLEQRNPDLVDRVAFGDRARALLDEADRAGVWSDEVLASSKPCQCQNVCVPSRRPRRRLRRTARDS